MTAPKIFQAVAYNVAQERPYAAAGFPDPHVLEKVLGRDSGMLIGTLKVQA